jgi:hypothetical protein
VRDLLPNRLACNSGRQEIACDGRDAQSINGIRSAIDCARCGEVDGRFT